MRNSLIFVALIIFATTTNAVSIYADDGTYLGELGGNPLHPDSTDNPIGIYGSDISPYSINNPRSLYGSPISPYSPNNPLAIPDNYYGDDE
jgi:hypothetical protein